MYEVRFKTRRQNKSLFQVKKTVATYAEAALTMSKYDYASLIHYIEIDDFKHVITISVSIKGNLITSVYKP